MLDQRVIRTRNGLQAALTALVLENGYESISIRDITNRAEIGYATFFRHYKSIDELLFDMLRSHTEALKAQLPIKVLHDPIERTRLLFAFILENKQLYRALLNGSGFVPVIEQVRLYAIADLEAELENEPEQQLPKSLIATFAVNSMMAILRWWLENDTPHPPEEMANIAVGLIFSNFPDKK